MRKIFIFLGCMMLCGGAAHAMNTTANIVRACQKINIGTSDNYILQCEKGDAISDLIRGETVRFFPASAFGDVRGAVLDSMPDDDEYVYVIVATNPADAQYQNQTCYRFITAKDSVRDGFYGVEVCEYERPDWYL